MNGRFGRFDFGRGYPETGHLFYIQNMHLCIKSVSVPEKRTFHANRQLARQLQVIPIMNMPG
jgi:hypothetical protein